MDSVTQFVLGAAIGEATLKPSSLNSTPDKPRFGLGAFLLGGLFGTLPDLDVLARPFLNGPEALGFHRGLSHSLFFCSLITLPLALLLKRVYPKLGLSLKRWSVFVWLALNTHWMIDSLTTYGTQVFLPFSDFPVNVGSVFIIDPLYTVPLLVGTLVSLFRNRDGRPIRPSGVLFALGISTFYLLLTLGSKYAVLQRFKASLARESIAYDQLITVPTPFNSILWYGYADDGTDVWVADSSLLDSSQRRITWQRIPKNSGLFPQFGEGPAGRRLLWFSRGFYRLTTVDGKPAFIDLRFGRLKTWLKPVDPEGTDYVFLFALKPEKPAGPYNDFGRARPQSRDGEVPWRLILHRVLGGVPAAGPRK